MRLFNVITYEKIGDVKKKHMVHARDESEAMRNALKRHPQANKAWIAKDD